MTPEQRLIEIAKSFVGVREEAPNFGKEIVEFQKAVDGVARGEPWCLAFIQYCVKKTEEEFGLRSRLHQTEHVLTLWNASPRELRIPNPEPGCLVIWQFWKDGRPTALGHAGLVTEILTEKLIATVEGNTGPGVGVNREGDGVYLRSRFSYSFSKTMRVRGFLRCWDPNQLGSENEAKPQ